MRDKDGFLIKCKYSEWRIFDERDNFDDICGIWGGKTHCYADDKCIYYEPDIKADLRDQIVESGYIYHPPK